MKGYSALVSGDEGRTQILALCLVCVFFAPIYMYAVAFHKFRLMCPAFGIVPCRLKKCLSYYYSSLSVL